MTTYKAREEHVFLGSEIDIPEGSILVESEVEEHRSYPDQIRIVYLEAITEETPTVE